jgi:hypothetical protein
MTRQAVAGNPIKVAIPKSRKRGISTFAQAWQYHLSDERSEFNSLTAAHRTDDTDEIFSIAQRYHEHIHGRIKSARRTIKFPHTNSKYRCMTAMGNFGGSGSDNHAIHISEAALIENKSGQDAENLAAMTNSMPQGSPNTSLIMESTGMGPKGLFASICMKAAAGDSDFECVFISWLEDPDLVDNKFTGGYEDFKPALTNYEKSMIDLGATPQQLAWRRKKIRNDHPDWDITQDGNPPLFGYHYPATLEECFSEVAGAIYPRFSRSRHTNKKIEIQPSWDRYRAIDWGWSGQHAFVVLWVAHDPNHPPRLAFAPDIPKEVIGEFISYCWDEKAQRPKKENDHAPDALRCLVVTMNLTGLVYVYRAMYVLGAANYGPVGMARMIHEWSGWKLADGCDEDNLAAYVPGRLGEQYVTTVADRSQQGLITQFSNWGIPCIGHGKPHPRDNSMGEVLDGISDVSVLISGTSEFYPESPNLSTNPLVTALNKIKARRPLALTEAEEAALNREYGSSEPNIDDDCPLSVSVFDIDT